MIALISLIARRRRVVAVALALPLLVVLGWLFVADKTFESTGVVRVDPLGLPAPHAGERADPNRAEAVEAELRIARRDVAEAMRGSVPGPFTYTVHADADTGTFRFDASAGSATEAWDVASGATTTFARIHNEADDANRSGAEIVQEPEKPGAPVSPDVGGPLLAAFVVGLALALPAAWLADRIDKRPAEDPPVPPAATGSLPRLALSVVAVGIVPAVLLASGAVGVLTMWALRPSTDRQVEWRARCVDRWLDEVPDGARISPQAGSTGELQTFWVDSVTEAAFPRLQPTWSARDAEYVLSVLPAHDARRGREQCAGFKIRLRHRARPRPSDDDRSVCRPGGQVSAPAITDGLRNEATRSLIDTFVRQGDLREGPRYRGYQILCDTLGSTRFGAPAAWDDRYRGEGGIITASTDLAGRVEAEPVVGLSASRSGSPTSLDQIGANAQGSLESGTRAPRSGRSIAEGCSPKPPVPYDDGTFHGLARSYVDCDGDRRAWLLVSVVPNDRSDYHVDLIGQALTSGDAEALGHALETMKVAFGRLPAP